jgi:integrase
MKRINSNKIGDVWMYQRQPKGNWYYSLTLSTGKKVEKSFGTPNLGRATEMAKNLKTNESSNSQSKEILNRPSTLQEALNQYLTYLSSEGRQPTTIKRYKGIFKSFADFSHCNKITKIEQLDQRLLNQFRMDRADKIKDSTRYYETERLVEFGSYLMSEGLLVQNPFSLGKLRKAIKEPLPWFTLPEVEQILNLARLEDSRIFEVLAFTGLRIGEMSRLKWSDIDFKKGVLTVLSTIKNPTKGKSSRVIPMHSRVIKVLTNTSIRSSYVFNSSPSSKHPDGDGQINKSGLSTRLKKICKKLSINGCVHSFRKFFCSYMANKGVPVLTLKEWSGHKEIRVLIDSYYKLHLNDSVDFMNKVSLEDVKIAETSNTERQSRDTFRDTKEI